MTTDHRATTVERPNNTSGSSAFRSLRSSLVAGLVALVVGVTIGHGNVAAQGEFSNALVWAMNASELTTREHQRVTYEAGEEEIYSQTPGPDRLSTTDLIARLGSRAGTVLLLPDDPAYRGNLGYRSEWQSDVYADEGSEYAYGASYYLPDDWDQGYNRRTFDDRIIFQFHEGNGKSPTFSLHIDADEGDFFVRNRRPNGNFQTLWRGPLETNEWFDFAFRVRWSKDNDGFFQIYLNGRLEHQYTGRTLNDSHRVYTKWGIYGQPTRLAVDEVAIMEGPDGLFDATAAEVATIMDPIPRNGIALVRFSGGLNEDLVASSGCRNSAMFWFTLGGELIWYNASAPSFVNARWDQVFDGEIPRNTLLIAACGDR